MTTRMCRDSVEQQSLKKSNCLYHFYFKMILVSTSVQMGRPAFVDSTSVQMGGPAFVDSTDVEMVGPPESLDETLRPPQVVSRKRKH